MRGRDALGLLDARAPLIREAMATVGIELGTLESLGRTIQFAVAPVFLLTAIASLLVVMTNRLGRSIDRAREIEGRILRGELRRRAEIVKQLQLLDHRMALTHRAIEMCTAAGLLICLVIALLFVGELLTVEPRLIVAGGFVVAMVLLIAGMSLFLREIRVALRTVRVEERYLHVDVDADD